MDTAAPASEATKTTLENSVGWFLSEALANATMPIVTQKYLTKDNLLVYLTHCDVAETAVPRIKVQVFRRVENGVHETGYQLFGDHRLEQYENAMVFGTAPETAVPQGNNTVSEQACQQLIALVNSLQDARKTL